jgi:hypothetical protein
MSKTIRTSTHEIPVHLLPAYQELKGKVEEIERRVSEKVHDYNSNLLTDGVFEFYENGELSFTGFGLLGTPYVRSLTTNPIYGRDPPVNPLSNTEVRMSAREVHSLIFHYIRNGYIIF